MSKNDDYAEAKAAYLHAKKIIVDFYKASGEDISDYTDGDICALAVLQLAGLIRDYGDTVFSLPEGAEFQ